MPSLACWDCGFESRRGHGSLSRVSVVCCQLEVSASDWSLVQRNPTDCGVSECVREASTIKSPWQTRVCCAMEGEGRFSLSCSIRHVIRTTGWERTESEIWEQWSHIRYCITCSHTQGPYKHKTGCRQSNVFWKFNRKVCFLIITVFRVNDLPTTRKTVLKK